MVVSSSLPIGADHPLQKTDAPDDEWDTNWKYREEITTYIPISHRLATYQPIDMQMFFEEKCWALNESVHSIRVCCWQNNRWYELESQIYDLVFTEEPYLFSCGLIFLVPNFADGTERYYMYYDDLEKSSPDYVDHVSVKDSYYYVEPIPGIFIEGDYYEIIEDDFIIYGIGQKGQVMDRKLSQIAIKMKPGSKTFDILNSDLITSFSYSYQDGMEDSDEISSDQELLSKEITIDGPLMLEFRIISQSSNGALKSSNSYRYYYHPNENKRIYAHVYHEVLENSTVTGITDADGKYVGIISYHSISPTVKKMIFGEILPYLHTYNEYDGIDEYQLDLDPESSDREWIISSEDDCDLGQNAWISYSEGSKGKTHGIIFSKSTDLVTNATNERDGLQVKVSEREYLDVVGAEVDYASISVGRNSYEPMTSHDIFIEKGATIEADIEFVTFQNGTYEDINEESRLFQTLNMYRHNIGDNDSIGQLTYTITVIPHLFGRILSFPLLRDITGISLPHLTAELYENETMIAKTPTINPLIGFQRMKFPKIPAGAYTIRIFREYGNNTKRYIGVGSLSIKNDTTIHIYCTWEKPLMFHIHDQYLSGIPNVTIQCLQNNQLVFQTETTDKPSTSIGVPFPLFNAYETDSFQNISFSQIFNKANPYKIQLFYKGFRVYNTTLSLNTRQLEVNISLHDLIINITDELGMKPAVNVRPHLISKAMVKPQELQPTQSASYGWHRFEDLPNSIYLLQISYGGYRKNKEIDVPSCGETVDLRFALLYQLDTKLLTRRAESISFDDATYSIKRNGEFIHYHIDDTNPLLLPPGTYTVNVYNNRDLIGSASIELSTDKSVEILTTLPSLLYFIVTMGGFSGIAISILFLFMKKITLNTCLKIITLGLVIMALVQPWWTMTASTDEQSIEKSTNMYLSPQVMIEEYEIDDQLFLSLETIPEMFTEFVHLLLMIIWVGIGFMCISFIPNMLLNKRFSLLLAVVSICFVIAVALAFSFGMSRITEISLGSLQGSAILPMQLPSEETVYLQTQWGLGIGFYFVILAAALSLSAGVIDFIIGRQSIFFRLHKKKNKKLPFNE